MVELAGGDHFLLRSDLDHIFFDHQTRVNLARVGKHWKSKSWRCHFETRGPVLDLDLKPVLDLDLRPVLHLDLGAGSIHQE